MPALARSSTKLLASPISTAMSHRTTHTTSGYYKFTTHRMQTHHSILATLFVKIKNIDYIRLLHSPIQCNSHNSLSVRHPSNYKTVKLIQQTLYPCHSILTRIMQTLYIQAKVFLPQNYYEPLTARVYATPLT